MPASIARDHVESGARTFRVVQHIGFKAGKLPGVRVRRLPLAHQGERLRAASLLVQLARGIQRRIPIAGNVGRNRSRAIDVEQRLCFLNAAQLLQADAQVDPRRHGVRIDSERPPVSQLLFRESALAAKLTCIIAEQARRSAAVLDRPLGEGLAVRPVSRAEIRARRKRQHCRDTKRRD